MDTILNFNNILQAFRIKANCVNYQQINNCQFYDLKLKPGGKIKDLQKFGDEIALSLKTPCKPSVKVLHEEGLVRLEFVYPRKEPLKLNYLFTTPRAHGQLMCLLGQSLDGNKVWMDLAQNPHLIVAGTTGSGKSTLLHNIIANLQYYNNVDLHLIDPKNIEFAAYQGNLPNTQVINTYESALHVLNSLLQLMEVRYQYLRSNGDASLLTSQIVIIDEFADLIMQDQEDRFYNALCRLAQKCRAAKIHIILSTQRPSVKVIDGNIKANFPARIACRTASHIDSKIILDSVGAENLLGHGDALLRDNSRFLERFQTAYISPHETVQLINQLKSLYRA